MENIHHEVISTIQVDPKIDCAEVKQSRDPKCPPSEVNLRIDELSQHVICW